MNYVYGVYKALEAAEEVALSYHICEQKVNVENEIRSALLDNVAEFIR